MDTHTLLVGVVAGPGGGFDINAADCDHWVFSSKVIHRQAALWLKLYSICLCTHLLKAKRKRAMTIKSKTKPKKSKLLTISC